VQPIPAVLSFDCWTSTNSTALVAAIATFIDEQWSLCTALLGIRELGEAHDANALSTVLMQITTSFLGLRF